ncbi:Transposase [Shigella dysenteriae 1617]|uniref:Transposase n=1 Tax=Shigella dysenteriae 1617 TaxID=754093 RepID=A0A0A6ZZF4_SHIDY|nr:Transposase [Shigella dysenteriae 1617]
MAVTAAKSVMAFRVLTMAVDLCRLTTRTMNVNAGHERTSKARIIHQIQLIRGITNADVIKRIINLSYTFSKDWQEAIDFSMVSLLDKTISARITFRQLKIPPLTIALIIFSHQAWQCLMRDRNVGRLKPGCL